MVQMPLLKLKLVGEVGNKKFVYECDMLQMLKFSSVWIFLIILYGLHCVKFIWVQAVVYVARLFKVKVHMNQTDFPSACLIYVSLNLIFYLHVFKIQTSGFFNFFEFTTNSFVSWEIGLFFAIRQNIPTPQQRSRC